MKGTLHVVSFSTCVRQPDKHVWYSKARRVELFELEQIASAIQAKNERDARNELRDLKARLTRLESSLASGDANFHSPTIDFARELLRHARGMDRA